MYICQRAKSIFPMAFVLVRVIWIARHRISIAVTINLLPNHEKKIADQLQSVCVIYLQAQKKLLTYDVHKNQLIFISNVFTLY